MAQPDPLAYTYPFQLTKTIRRDPYDAISPAKPENSASGKIILVTGGGTGIGAAAARVWAKAGADGVILAGRRVGKLEENAVKIRAAHPKTKVLCVGTDLLKDGDVEDLFRQAVTEFGRSPDVVLSNAGVVEDATIGEHGTESWWNILGVNLKGTYSTMYHYINTSPDPRSPSGTFISVNSGLAGFIAPGVSAYSISKLGAQRLIEYLHFEYPSLRSYTLFPGIVKTPIMTDRFEPFAGDHEDRTGMLALYLASQQGDWLRGSTTSINWDVEEMEANKEKIVSENLLKIKWMPILPASGGSGL